MDYYYDSWKTGKEFDLRLLNTYLFKIMYKNVGHFVNVPQDHIKMKFP